ncbi:MAG TPA: sigma-70 family RNA polymerase sigma factor [Kofleriaceae bacterium]|nr:sigma-70 family RNA polymerase sigma factor [Kofleriaceae bacterium]
MQDLDHRLSELMRAAQDGDRLAYEALLTEVAAAVRDFVRKRLHDVDSQEEIVQDTLLSIHRDRHTYDPERPFRPWMYAIARHRLFDHLEKQRRRNRFEVLAEAEVEDPGSADASARDHRAPGILRRALAQLSKAQREIIQMLKFDGLSVAEISTRTGLTASTVKVTAHRGYKRLRVLIGDPEP